jgi:hypothetical protein
MHHNFESVVRILGMSHVSVIRHVHELKLYLWVVNHRTSGSLLRRLSAWPSSYYMKSKSLGPVLLSVVSTQTSPSISVRKETYCYDLHLSSDRDKVTPMAPHWVGTFDPLHKMTEIHSVVWENSRWWTVSKVTLMFMAHFFTYHFHWLHPVVLC